MRVGIGIVHLAADGYAPIARADGEPDVEADSRRDYHDVPEAELMPDYAGGEGELDNGRRAVQNDVADDVLDSRRPALDDARQTAGPPLQMKAQREIVKMHESAECELPDRVQSDPREECVADLREAAGEEAPYVVGEHESHGRRDEKRDEGRRARLPGQRVGHPFVGIGHHHAHHLGGDQRGKGNDDTELQVRPVERPHVGPEVPERRKRAAAVGGDLRSCSRVGHHFAPRVGAATGPAMSPAISSRSTRSAPKAAGFNT